MVAKEVEEWEAKVNKIKEEWDFDIGEQLRVACLLSVLPKDLQDVVYQGLNIGREIKYNERKQKVFDPYSHGRGWDV